jgi:tetratricopeptide (TPR) repeat protein
MEAAGRQPGAPRALRVGKSALRRFKCARNSARSLAIPFAFLFLGALPAQAWAQHWAGSVNPGSPSQSGIQPAQLGVLPEPPSATTPSDNSRLITAESCDSWTAAAVNSPTVSVERLAVPKGARAEFQKACEELKDGNFQGAEERVRKAVELYPDYAAAWVVLGQALNGEHKDSEAVQACKQAMKVDPTYAPPYLCLAQFAEHTNKWDDVYTFSGHALSLEPATDPYAYFYTAAADLHLKRYAQAELNGRSAEKLDTANQIPELHLLLARIYQAEGNKSDEVVELQKFLELSPHNPDWQTARTTLAEIQDNAAK